MSAAPNYSYTPDQVIEAFDRISPKIFNGITRETTPKILVVAGVQGSGKTYLLEKTLLRPEKTHPYVNYVRLYLPEYRKEHPQYADMIKLGVLHAYEHTEAFVRELCAKLFEQAFVDRYNIIMECAFDSFDFATWPPFATEQGYQFEVHIVGCTQTFAQVSSIDRGLASLQKNELERFVTVSQLKASMNNAQPVIRAFETAAKAVNDSRIFLYQRGFGALYERRLLAQSTYCKAASGRVTTTTTHVDFAYSSYAEIVEKTNPGVAGRGDVVKACHLALSRSVPDSRLVPAHVYNDLYACIVKHVNR